MSNDQGQNRRYIFPEWTNLLPTIMAICSVLILTLLVLIFWYWFTDKNFSVGYAPEQPIPYSHRLHAGELGIDCRYCHTNVEKSPAASIPSAEICLNCHNVIKTDSPHIKKIKESVAQNKPIEWVRVHQLPDYTYFDHSRHISAGVSCVSCHGRIDQMEVVRQVESLAMAWCLDCHRDPAPHIRPRDMITQLDWTTDDPVELGEFIRKKHKIMPSQDCSTCHR